MDFKEHENTMTNQQAMDALDKLKGPALYDAYVNSYLADQFGEYSSIKETIYKMKYADIPLLDDVIKGNFVDNNKNTVYGYWRKFQYSVYGSDGFPFGYLEDEFFSYKKKMKRRLEDVKSKVLVPPSFKSSVSYGLKEMKAFIDNKQFASNLPKPRVKGKTIMLPIFSNFSYDDQNFRKLSRYTYLNKFDNVEIPAAYLIKYRYGEETNYFMYSHLYIINSLMKGLLNAYNNNSTILSKYEIICFNLFLFPLKEKYIEIFMNFIIAFQEGHPHIYIKDVSGKGYNVYKHYSFYEKLRTSRIDVSVIK